MSYTNTKIAAYTGYVTQAIVIIFPPLLYVIFQESYGLSSVMLGLLSAINFLIQISVDLLMAKIGTKIGYRKAAVIAHICAVIGLTMYSYLPNLINPFAAILIATFFNAIGGGLTEVIISPIIEAIPGDKKAGSMSLLHSFYSWGCVAVILGTTLYFALFSQTGWQILCCIWALVPLVNTFMFMFVPIITLEESDKKDISISNLFKDRIFLLFLVTMICAGASEQAISQWVSYFAEASLGITKTIGDLLGACLFAILMGISRVFFGIKGDSLNLKKALMISGCLCIIGYLTASFAPIPIISLLGCALCGLAVGLMWPGTYSIASKECNGGTTMFSLLAFGGDVGCSCGPLLVGAISSIAAIKTGILCATVFPLLLIICIYRIRKSAI